MISRRVGREDKRTRHTAVDSNHDVYDKRPDVYQGERCGDVIEVWIASNLLENVEAVSLDNDLWKTNQTQMMESDQGETHAIPSGGWGSRDQSRDQYRCPDSDVSRVLSPNFQLHFSSESCTSDN